MKQQPCYLNIIMVTCCERQMQRCQSLLPPPLPLLCVQLFLLSVPADLWQSQVDQQKQRQEPSADFTSSPMLPNSSSMCLTTSILLESSYLSIICNSASGGLLQDISLASQFPSQSLFPSCSLYKVLFL